MQDSLLSQGLSLLVYGMGTVYVFLAILVLVTTSMSRLIARYFPPAPEPERKAAPKAKSASPAAVEPHILNAITQAVAQHRSEKR